MRLLPCLVTKVGRGEAGQSQRRLKPTEIDQLLAAYTAGELVNDIAVRFGVSRTTVIGHVTRRGLPRRSEPRWSATELQVAANLYSDGHSLAAVGARFNIHAETVRNRFRRAGVQVRTRRGWS
jgi:DNA-binding CsgD family transcriptional regulator